MLIKQIWGYINKHPYEFLSRLCTQLKLSYLSLLIATLICIPLGIWCYKNKKVSVLVINFVNSLRVIPSLAILAIMIPVLGTGFIPSLIALIFLACPPILFNTFAGLKNVDKAIIESSTAMGMNNFQTLFKIEFPLAMPIIIAGCKTSAIEVIASSTLAAFIGGGGLGEYIISGVNMIDIPLILIGTIPIALIALITELLLEILDKIFFIWKG
ncbi:ABC transporter permease [Clostridium aestuarii]|uniref:ABC transporter permease n=1 Tax=Clostridium aestuarii TaxID=338193 RepID=A0ABT4D008_9CLOT|nr:ABC transporter permease [Clostridium aestuarii]MCY6484574.1 ABC transporter permease [Clostridium aestuarii]